MYDNLSIIVPVFNEEDTISFVISELCENFNDSEIIIVNDGSTDLTKDKIFNSNLITKIKYIENNSNRGYGYSLRNGVKNSSKDYVIFFDSDNQFDIEDIKKMHYHISKKNLDTVIGIRKHIQKQPYIKVFNRYLLKLSVSLITNKKIEDVNCGLRIFKKNFLKSISIFFPDGFSASTTSTIYSILLPINLDFLEVETKERENSYSKVKFLKDGFLSAANFFKLINNFKSFRFYFSFSFIFFLISVFYSIHVIFRDQTGVPIGGLLMFTTSIFIFLVGIILEQISSLKLQLINDKILQDSSSLK